MAIDDAQQRLIGFRFMGQFLKSSTCPYFLQGDRTNEALGNAVEEAVIVVGGKSTIYTNQVGGGGA